MDRELDMQVAEALGLEVVGWEPARPDPECPSWYVDSWSDEKQPAHLAHCVCDILDEGYDEELLGCGHVAGCLEVVPFYSTDIATAWKLVETMVKGTAWECYISHQFDGWDCAFDRPDKPGAEGHGDTVSEAICKGFLEVATALSDAT